MHFQPESLSEILKRYRSKDPNEAIVYEYQEFGYRMVQSLNDDAHLSLYIKLARDKDRNLMEKALSFIRDANAKFPARLFMWKLKQLEMQNGKSASTQKVSSDEFL
jgi:hypothetical protein